MEDFEMSLGVKESAHIEFGLGEKPSTCVRVFLWAYSVDEIKFAISVDGDEKFVASVSDRGNRIKINGDTAMHQLNIFTKETNLEYSIRFLREHEPPEGYFFGHSGGKDSVVAYDVAKRAGVRIAPYYSATGIDPPEVGKFLRHNYPEVIWKRPKESFFRLIPKKGYPTKSGRWCCDELKKKPTKDIPLSKRIMGIRAEESANRARRGEIGRINKLTIVKPVFAWKEWEIWEYIDKHNLPYCSLYDEGFGRIGCVVCPFLCKKNKKNLVRHMNRWPAIYSAFEKSMKRLWETKKDMSGFDDFLKCWYLGISPPKIPATGEPI